MPTWKCSGKNKDGKPCGKVITVHRRKDWDKERPLQHLRDNHGYEDDSDQDAYDGATMDLISHD